MPKLTPESIIEKESSLYMKFFASLEEEFFND